MISFSVVSSGANFVVFIDVPLLETSCSVYRCAFIGDFMIRPKNLQDVLNLRSSIIIRGEIHILKSSDVKDLGYVVRIDGELFSSYLAF